MLGLVFGLVRVHLVVIVSIRNIRINKLDFATGKGAYIVIDESNFFFY